jgi:UDP-N-acetylmuramyl pentapeptide synthase
MISLSSHDLAALLGVTALTKNYGAYGIAHTALNIRGGELYLPLQSADAQVAAVTQAFERGAAWAIVENASELPVEDASRCLCVASLVDALRVIALWWAKRFKLCFVLGDYAATTVKDMLAAVLLAQARGAYAQTDGDSLLISLCQISSEHLWATFEVQLQELLALEGAIEPKLLVLTGVTPGPQESELVTMARANKLLDETIKAFPSSLLLLNAADKFLGQAATKHSGQQIFSYESDRRVATYSVTDIKSYGLAGVEGEFHSPQGSSAFTVKVPGEHQALNAAAAIGAAMLLYPSQALSSWIDELPKFSAPRFKLKFIPLRNFRRLLNEVGRGDQASFAAAFKLCADFTAEELRVAILLGEVSATESQRASFWQSQLQILKKAASAGVLLIGEQAEEQNSLLQAQGISAQREFSPEALAQLARALNFDILLVKGADTAELRKVAEVLIERESQFSI